MFWVSKWVWSGLQARGLFDSLAFVVRPLHIARQPRRLFHTRKTDRLPGRFKPEQCPRLDAAQQPKPSRFNSWPSLWATPYAKRSAAGCAHPVARFPPTSSVARRWPTCSAPISAISPTTHCDNLPQRGCEEAEGGVACSLKLMTGEQIGPEKIRPTGCIAGFQPAVLPIAVHHPSAIRRLGFQSADRYSSGQQVLMWVGRGGTWCPQRHWPICVRAQ
jgi:hypothetical protein